MFSFGRLGAPAKFAPLPEPVLPPGAIGVWYSTSYQDSPRRVIPNAVSATPVSANLITGPRRVFGHSDLWGIVSGTITANAAAGPDGEVSAAALSGADNWYFRPGRPGTIPAGTYTLAVDIKRNAATDQQFTFCGDYTQLPKSAVQTATAAWQRFAYTFTLPSPGELGRVLIWSATGSGTADILIDNYALYAGTSDLGAEVLDGHMVLGASGFDASPPVTGGEVDFSTGGWGLVQFAAAHDLTNAATACALIRRDSATSYEGLLSEIQSYSEFTFASAVADHPHWYFGGVVMSPDQQAGMWHLNGLGYHMLSLRRTSTAVELWLDDCRLVSTTGTASTVSIRDLFAGIVASVAFTAPYKLHAMGLWDRSLSDTEIGQVLEKFQSTAVAAGLTAGKVQRLLVAEGDSITAGQDSAAYAVGAHLSTVTPGFNYAVLGSNLSHLVARATAVDAVLPADRTGRTFLLYVLLGANDIGSGMTTGQVDTWLTSFSAYLDARRAAGWKVVLGTILPSASADRNTNRNYANPILRTWVGTHCDALADYAADATIGPDSAGANTTWFPDGLHPSATYSNLMEPILRAAINSL